jgi:hypothetical protein
VDEFGASRRREGLETSFEPRLHLIEPHDVEANPSSRRGRRRGATRHRHTIRVVARRSPASRCDRIADLAQTLALLLDDAADAGARKSGGMEFVGRGRGFTDSDPTGTAALDPRRSQIRKAARRAALLVEQAELTLEEASGVIANGYLRLDSQEWIRAVEKRRAALGR